MIEGRRCLLALESACHAGIPNHILKVQEPTLAQPEAIVCAAEFDMAKVDSHTHPALIGRECEQAFCQMVFKLLPGILYQIDAKFLPFSLGVTG